jgi:hypothetical protein
MHAPKRGFVSAINPSKPRVTQINKQTGSLPKKTKQKNPTEKRKKGIATCQSQIGIGQSNAIWGKKQMSDLRPDANVFEPGKTPMSRVECTESG